MALNDDIRTSVKMFRNGMYIQCKFILEKLKKLSRETGTFIEQIIIENNSTVCNIICPSRQNNQSVDPEIFSESFEILLTKIKNNAGGANPENLKTAISYTFSKFADNKWAACIFKCLICHVVIIYLTGKDLTNAQILMEMFSSLQIPAEDTSLTETVICIGMKKQHISLQTFSEDYAKICLIIFKMITSKLSGDNSLLYSQYQIQSRDFQFFTRYIKAYLEFDKKSKSVLYFEELKNYLDSLPVKDSFFESRIRNLMGCSLSLQNCPYMALQQFQAALIADENNLLSLYNISLQYRQLQLIDGEIDALKLLINQMNRWSSSSFSSDEKCLIISSVFEVVHPLKLISYEQLCYLLARRLLQLKRYKDAAFAYLHLIESFIKKPIIVQELNTQLPRLPPLKIIYHEAAYALVLCQRYSDALHVADEGIKAHVKKSADLGDDNALGESNHIKKSPRNEFSNGCSDDEVQLPLFNNYQHFQGFSEDVTALIIKFYALLQLEDDMEAFKLLHIILTAIMSSTIKLAENQESSEINRSTFTQKRAKIEERANPSETSTMTDEVIDRIKGFLYNCKALIQLKRNNVQDALHNFHLSLFADPDNIETRYNYTLFLIKLHREKEAFENWNKFRETSNMKNSDTSVTNMDDSKDDFIKLDNLAKEFLERTIALKN